MGKLFGSTAAPKSKRTTAKPRRRVSVSGLIVAFIVGLFLPVLPPIGFVGMVPSTVYYWKNPGRGGAAVAVERELFLPVPDLHRVPYYYSTQQTKTAPATWTWCRPDDIRPLKVGEPSPCRTAYSTNTDHCGLFNVDFNCNGIAVSAALWRDEALRARIISASLNACSYLYDPASGVVEESDERRVTEYGTVEYTLGGHVVDWQGSNCQAHQEVWVPGFGIQEIPWIRPREQDKTVFISVIDENSSPISRKQPASALYKATRKDGKIAGAYIDIPDSQD